MALPGWGRVLPDDKNLHLAHRAAESVEDITGGREGSVAGGVLGAQEIPHGVNLLFDRGEGGGPVLAHDGVQGLVQAYSLGWCGSAGLQCRARDDHFSSRLRLSSRLREDEYLR